MTELDSLFKLKFGVTSTELMDQCRVCNLDPLNDFTDDLVKAYWEAVDREADYDTDNT
jgi:hypothetical protein